ncbi:hypothetical protein AVEN_131771-1 [Araneus ventricosus]|uniref:Uncharacterized protein n=1 Tax=Araneus ventricosus TaxID=182803 RepID=A0A4Y2EKN1_ARAVE|nr:hypothetical protein AVEN_131771-1 [Araneus ventricosus]
MRIGAEGWISNRSGYPPLRFDYRAINQPGGSNFVYEGAGDLGCVVQPQITKKACLKGFGNFVDGKGKDCHKGFHDKG